MNNHEIMSKGISLLDSMLEGDIEEAIEALEEALEAYRLILKFKKAIKKFPSDLKSKMHYSVSNKRIFDFVKEFPEGVENREIVAGTGVSANVVSQTLSRNSDLYENVKHGVWRLKGKHALSDNEMGPREDAVASDSL